MQGMPKKNPTGAAKGGGKYVPYDMQKGARVEGDRKSDVDEEENYALQRQLSN